MRRRSKDIFCHALWHREQKIRQGKHMAHFLAFTGELGANDLIILENPGGMGEGERIEPN